MVSKHCSFCWFIFLRTTFNKLIFLLFPDYAHHQHSSCMGMAMTQGLGYQELDRWLQKPRPLLFTFHLLAALPPDKYEPDAWQLNADQKLESLNVLKQQGNERFN